MYLLTKRRGRTVRRRATSTVRRLCLAVCHWRVHGTVPECCAAGVPIAQSSRSIQYAADAAAAVMMMMMMMML